MASLAAQQRSAVATLTRVTQFLGSSSGGIGAGACQQQLSQLLAQLEDVRSLPHVAAPSFQGEQELLQALVRALTALADGRHARTQDWVLMLCAMAYSWSGVVARCTTCGDRSITAQFAAWRAQMSE
jgi:hypothetical protein